jgi:hypothetical protein
MIKILNCLIIFSVISYFSYSWSADCQQINVNELKQLLSNSKILDIDRINSDFSQKINLYKFILPKKISLKSARIIALKFIKNKNILLSTKNVGDEYYFFNKYESVLVNKYGYKITYFLDENTIKEENTFDISDIKLTALKKLKDIINRDEIFKLTTIGCYSSDNDFKVIFRRFIDDEYECAGGSNSIRMYLNKYGCITSIKFNVLPLQFLKEVNLTPPSVAFKILKNGNSQLYLYRPINKKIPELGNVRKCKIYFDSHYMEKNITANTIPKFIIPFYAFYIEDLSKNSKGKPFIVSSLAVSENTLEFLERRCISENIE